MMVCAYLLQVLGNQTSAPNMARPRACLPQSVWVVVDFKHNVNLAIIREVSIEHVLWVQVHISVCTGA